MRNIKIPAEPRKEAESGNILNNQILQSIFDDSLEAIFILDYESFKILECNNKAVELFQAEDKQQLISLPSFRLYESEPIEFSKKLLETTLKQGNTHTQELAFRTLKSNVFWGRLTKKPVNIDEQGLIILKVNKVVDYIRSEDVLSTLLHGTAKVTGKSFFRELSKLLSRTFGVKYVFVAKFKDEKKKLLQTVTYRGNSEELDDFIFDPSGGPCENILNGYTSFYPKDLSDLFPDDKLVKELNIDSFIGAPIYSYLDNPVGVLVLMDDKPMEEIPNARYILSIFASRCGAELQRLKSRSLLREQTKKLADTNTSKDKFLAILSHDLKNPFNVIMGFTELILKNAEEYGKDKIVEQIEIINFSIKNIYSLLENLTDWSRIQREKISFKPENFDLNELIKDNLDLFSYLINTKNISIENKVKPGSVIYGDKEQINSVVRNLLSNAVKHTFTKGEIIISLKKKNSSIEFIVQDSGSGMLKEDIETFFNQENKLIKSNSEHEGGPGIGLMLCKEFIKMHNGQIKIESEPGKGTKIIVSLPQ